MRTFLPALCRLLATAAALFIGAHAQAQATVWSTPTLRSSVTGNMKPGPIARDAAGNLFIAGTCAVSGQDDICVAKLAAGSGSVLWTKTFNGVHDGADRPAAIAVDASGNPIVAGTCTFPSFITRDNLCVVKIDGASGTLSWSSYYTGQGKDTTATGLVLDGSGNAVVVAACTRNDGQGSVDFCVVKLNGASGAQTWATVLDGGTFTESSPAEIALDSAANVFVAGGCLQGSTVDYCTFKLSPGGTTLWTAYLDGPGKSTDRAYSLAVDAGGSPIVTGMCMQESGDANACTVKYSGADGVVLWSRVYGTAWNTSDAGTKVRLDGAGNAYVAMRCRDSWTDFDICVQRYAGATGNPDWEARYATPLLASDSITDLAVDASGNVFVTGACDDGTGSFARLFCTIKFANGVTAWVQVSSPTPGRAVGHRIVLDAAGNLLVSGDCAGNACAARLNGTTGTSLWSVTAVAVTSPAAMRLAQGAYDLPNTTQNLLARDAAGNLYVAAACHRATLDICVAKYSPAGALIWSVAWDGGVNGNDAPYAIMVDAKNDPAITGACATGPLTRGLCVIKFHAATGAVSWIRSLPNGEGRALVSNASFDIFVVGSCYNGAANLDVCTMKLAGGTGDILWSALYDGPGAQDDTGSAIALDTLGNPAVAGGCVTATFAGRVCVMLYDGATGALRTALVHSDGADTGNLPVAIAFNGNSTLYVTGHCRLGSLEDICTFKYTVSAAPALSVAWTARYNGPGGGDDWPVFLGIGPDGHPVVAGTCAAAASPYPGDICSMKLNAASGATLWTASYAGASDDDAWAGALDAVGNLFVAGSCGAAGSSSLCTIKYDGATGAQRWIHSVSTGSGGAGGSRAVIPTSDSIYVAADYRIDAEQSGVRLFRVSNDASAPSVASVVRATSNPIPDTWLSPLIYTVTFSDAVTGVDAADFSLTTTGTVANASITGVTGGGSTYTVTIAHGTGTGTGTIRLNVVDNDTIVDDALNPLNGVGTGTSFTAGEVFTVVGSLGFSTSSFAAGFYNTAYSATVAATGGAPAYAFTVFSGALPNGLSLSSAGTFSGTPTTLGSFNFTLRVQDTIGQVATHAYSIVISQAPQAITFNALANKPIGSAPFVVSAAGGASGNPVTFTSVVPSVCTATGTNGSTVTMLTVGLCTIRASQAGNTNYAAAPSVERVFSVTPTTQELSVNRSGASSGTVTSSPAGINCGASCIASFPIGATVTLGVIPDPGSNFAGWGGDCSGLTCTVTMNAAKNVMANFQPASQTLSVVKSGTGTGNVLSAPTGIDCGAGCTSTFNYGSTVTLTPTPALGSKFTAWSGDCTGSGACLVTMDAAKSVTAIFTLASNVPSSVTMAFNPASVTCGAPAPWSATVSGAAGTPTGTVTLKSSGGTSLGNYNLSGAVAGSTILFAGFNGVASYFVVYNGNSTYASSQSALASINVTKATPGVVLSSGNNPATAGSSVTLTATVSRSGVCAIPDGSVTFNDGAATLGTVALDSSGVAALTTSALASGAHNLTAEYAGGSYYVAATSAPLAQTVGVANPARQDWNADGKPDLVWSNTANGATYLWYMNGPALASDAFVTQIDPSWKIQGVADFNGDGHPDLVWRNTANGNTYVWYMNGSTFVSDAFVFALPPEWVIQGVADFNGDGKPDFLMRNSVTGNAFAWFFNDNVPIGDQFLFSIDPSWKVEGVGDMNADGQPDLLFRNSGSGLSFAWFTQFTAGTLSLAGSTPALFGIDPAWEIVQVADWNGDGGPDFVFRNRNTGVVFVWYVSGTTLAGSDFITQIDPSWEIVPRR